jgi:hypothetical protein
MCSKAHKEFHKEDLDFALPRKVLFQHSCATYSSLAIKACITFLDVVKVFSSLGASPIF